jgi:prolyl oligopeptidase
MVKNYLVVTACIGLPALVSAQMNYPFIQKSDVIHQYHGVSVPDPYAWLEDDNAVLTKKWVQAQNAYTNNYLETIPFRSAVQKRLSELMNYPRTGLPVKQGNYLYYTYNKGLQNQAVWYRQPIGMPDKQEVFIDPNVLSRDGLISVGNMRFSKTAKFVAFTEQQSGSDWQQGYIMNVATKVRLGDQLDWLKFTSFAWKGDEGFYYTRYPAPDEKSKLSATNVGAQIYYHALNTKQELDQLIYEDKGHPNRFMGASLTEDGRFLVVRVSEGTSGAALWVQDLSNPESILTELIKGFETEPSVIDHIGGQLLVRTNQDAPNYKLVLVDPKQPEIKNWKTIIPEKAQLLEDVSTSGGALMVTYFKDATSHVSQYTYEGKLVREVKLPGIGTTSGFESKKNEPDTYYQFNSYNFPPTIYKYSTVTGVSTLFKKSEATFNSADYVVKQIFVTSTDGAKVPVFLTYKKNIKQDGKNPLLLYGYGGFNAGETPNFSAHRAVFLEQGGIYATACIRGGNEYGENWHRAGMLDKKQQVFDDFIAVASWLIEDQYTNADQLGIMGGSNGGLLVGACMTQRPDLFKVAIPMVGVMDMLRYHKFTIGYAWAVEYGSSDQKDQFEYLLKYSPLHNLKPGTQYPATLVTTADHDDRVVPAHSFKFAATLQEYQTGKNPALIRIESNAGHGAGMPISKQINMWTDVWSFIMYQLGVTYK